MITDTSNEIIQTIDNVIKPYIKIDNIKYSDHTIKMFSLLFNHIANSREHWNLNKNKLKYSKYTGIPCDISYYPTKIKKYIQHNIHTYYKINFNIREHDINVYIGSDKNTDNNVFLQKMIKNIYIWLFVAYYFSKGECSQTLEIYLSLTNEIKKLPSLKNEYVDRQHVNTAFTYACKKNNEIHIFRHEEWFKVFIHETFHSLGLDFSMFENTDTNNQIMKLFNVKNDVRIAETYCEFWAEIINNMFIVFSNTRWNENQEKWLNTLNTKLVKMMHYERIFSLFQCCKVLNYFNINYTELINSTKTVSSYKDKTHTLSYYIVKSIFMFHLDDYMQECIKLNGYSLDFNKKKNKHIQNMNTYCNIVKKMYKNENFIESLNSVCKISKNKKMFSKNIIETLRMSVYEVK
jgi:hypothetical protein